jgi:cardiolipin synthase
MKKVLACALTLLLAGCGSGQGFGAPESSFGDLGAQAAHRGRVGAIMPLIVEPDMGVQPLLNAIAAAKKSIWIEIYMFTDNGATAQLVAALSAKAKAGVDVELLIEPKPYIPPGPPNCSVTPDPTQVSAAAIAALTAAGVKVQQSDPRFNFTHEKAMVVDNAIAYIMTLNFSNSAFTVNREYIVPDANPVDVAEISNIFHADWARKPYAPQAPDLVVSPTNSRTKIINLIDSAQTSLVVESEYITDALCLQHLHARAAAGVKINVMCSFQPKDPCTGEDSNAKELQGLNAAGITQVEFTQTVTMHAKAIIADGKTAYVGSENLTANSLDRNREMGILLTDPASLQTLILTSQKDWAAH